MALAKGWLAVPLKTFTNQLLVWFKWKLASEPGEMRCDSNNHVRPRKANFGMGWGDNWLLVEKHSVAPSSLQTLGSTNRRSVYGGSSGVG
jgi:hypothetical protein